MSPSPASAVSSSFVAAAHSDAGASVPDHIVRRPRGLTTCRSLVASLLAAVVVVLLIAPAASLATTGHAFADRFGGAGNPGGIAVMPSTGDVFTADGNPASVRQLDAGGAVQGSFPIAAGYTDPVAVAVDAGGGGSVYLLAFGGDAGTAPRVLKYSTSGTFIYFLDDSGSGTSISYLNGAPGNSALAVDPADGTVYAVATDNVTGTQVIDRFDRTTGAFIASFDGSNGSPDGTGLQCPNGLAVDASHRVYVLDRCKGRVDRYDVTGAFQATVDDGVARGVPSAVAVDPASGEVYVSEAGPVGVQITQFTAGDRKSVV